MKHKLLPLTLSAFALLTLQSFGQDITVRPLQGWLDFLAKDASLSSVVHRIGKADEERNVDKIASDAQMYMWYGRFATGATKDDSLELIAIPDPDPNLRQMIVVAILDPVRRRGIYLPWAGRYLEDVPHESFIPHYLMDTLGSY
jgi:hypothetical protein